ncbi:MAG: GC-type dockerin domain-anchored protein [Phycisphaerales bacterium]
MPLELRAGDTVRDNEFFGSSVSMSGDVLLVGARAAASTPGVFGGAAHLYRRAGTAWNLEKRIKGNDTVGGDEFGISVCVRGDVAIVGAYLDDDDGSGSGSAYIFRRNGTDWVQEAKLTASDAAPGDRFGTSVAIDGDTAIVGAPFTFIVGFQTGTAYVFRRQGGAWSETAKLNAPVQQAGAFFGGFVALDGDVAVFSAIAEDSPNLTDLGSVYVHRRSGETWPMEKRIVPADGVAGQAFGSAVSLRGGALLVGSYLDAGPGGLGQGSAYVFRNAGTMWNQEAKIRASDGAADDLYGSALAISGDAAIVGAYQRDAGATDAGMAYLHRRRPNGLWYESGRVSLAMPGMLDYFASAVAIDGAYAAGGCLNREGPTMNAGAAYVIPLAACACEANCDASTGVPVLNVADFICYLNRFAAGDAYANCDGSTTPPTLNVADFICYQNKFAAGCP